LFSALGDLFYQTSIRQNLVAQYGTAEVSKVAQSQSEFQRLLETDMADDWLLPPLIEKLIKAGSAQGAAIPS